MIGQGIPKLVRKHKLRAKVLCMSPESGHGAIPMLREMKKWFYFLLFIKEEVHLCKQQKRPFWPD